MTGSYDLTGSETRRHRHRATSAVVMLMVPMLSIASCSGPPESGTETKAEQAVITESVAPPSPPIRPALPAVDAKELLETMEQLVAAYNKRSYVVASRYVNDAVVARCGGAQNYALASRLNAEAEQLRYVVERVKVTGGDETRVQADVYYSSTDVRTGSAVDVSQGNGLTFVRSNRADIRWVLAEAFPLGTAGYCR